MQVLPRNRALGCRKSLWGVFFVLLAALGMQWQYVECAQRAMEDEQKQHLRRLTARNEQHRKEQIARGVLWEGSLHDAEFKAQHAGVDSTAVVARDHLFAENIPFELDEQYLISGEIHQCQPGSDSCASGGVLRLTTSDGDAVFDCQVGLFQGSGVRPSFYALLWGAEAPASESEKQSLLAAISADTAHPDAALFRDSLTAAYADSEAEGEQSAAVGESHLLRLFQYVARAVLEHRRFAVPQ